MAMSEFDAKQVSPFKHLWKVDDKSWMKQRRAEAKHIQEYGFQEGTSKKYRKDFAKFYTKGEKEAYISSCELYFCVPITSPKEASLLFNSRLFGPSERKEVLTKYLQVASDLGGEFPWLRQHIGYFVDGVLGHEYRYIEEPEGRVTHVISPTPGFWCEIFMYDAISVLTGKRSYHACVDSVDYFVSALAHSDDARYRHPDRLKKMFVLVDDVLSDGGASDVVYDFAVHLKSKETAIMDNWNLHSELD